MNFLAHIYLSGNDDEIIIGNFMADAVKGRKYENYPDGIRKGILLHRAIDSYTDQHPTVKKSKSKLYEGYGHYSGVIVDILYDHFLAANWSEYHDQPLEDYVEAFYERLRSNFDTLPARYKRMMPYMVADNWLVKYATVDGIGVILSQMNRRTQQRSKMDQAIKELKFYYDDFEAEFRSYFAELIDYCRHKLQDLE